MRIQLDPWREDDLDAIAEIFDRTDRSFLSDGLPLPYTRAHAEDWYERNVLPREGISGLYRVIRSEGNCAGAITLDCKGDVYRLDADIGYILLPEYSGRGVMSEALGIFCEEAFRTLDIQRISARVFSPNIASAGRWKATALCWKASCEAP